jgi:hypothetical protein
VDSIEFIKNKLLWKGFSCGKKLAI